MIPPGYKNLNDRFICFYDIIVSFELKAGGPRWEKNSDLELVGGRDNRYNNERNKRAFHSAAVSKESINDNYNTTCRAASYTCCRHQVWLCAG